MQAASAVPFQPDAGNNDPTRWSLPGHDNIKARLGQGRVSATALSPDGRWVLVASDAGFWWHDAADMSLHALWTEYASDAAFSPDGQTIVNGRKKNGARLGHSNRTHRNDSRTYIQGRRQLGCLFSRRAAHRRHCRPQKHCFLGRRDGRTAAADGRTHRPLGRSASFLAQRPSHRLPGGHRMRKGR